MLTEEQIDKAKVEEVFRLQGELDDKPITFPEGYNDDGTQSMTWPEGTPRVLLIDMTEPTRSFRYSYDGAPEYAGEDFDFDAETFTVIRNVMFGLPERVLVDDNGKIWMRAAVYTGSGETECPCATFDPLTQEDGRDLKVTQEQADVHDGKVCHLCEEPVGQEHGFIYLGEGESEVVYLAVGYVRGRCAECGELIDDDEQFCSDDCKDA